MKLKLLCLSFFLFFYSLSICYSQDWMIFKASDAVRDFQLHDNHMWVISGSGLHKIDIITGERITWNTLNSGLPDHTYSNIAIDNSGAIWLGGWGSFSFPGWNDNHIVRFDGINWDIFDDINGDSFSSTLDIKVGASSVCSLLWVLKRVMQSYYKLIDRWNTINKY